MMNTINFNPLESIIKGFQNKNHNTNNFNYDEELKSAFEEYKNYLHKKTDSAKQNSDEEDYWLQRKKRTKKLLEMQQEMFQNFYELKQLSDRKAEIKTAQLKSEGLINTSNPMQIITGIPAKFLLSMLTADTKA